MCVDRESLAYQKNFQCFLGVGVSNPDACPRYVDLPDITTISKVANNGLVVGMEPVVLWSEHQDTMIDESDDNCDWQKTEGLRSVALE